MSRRPARRRVRLIATVALAALLVSFSGLVDPAAADEPAVGSWMGSWLAQPQLTGNWFGARDALASWGITPSIRYATDLLANAAGGQERARAYAGQLTVEVGVDMEKLAGLRGLTLDISGDWASGTDLSADIGNVFTVAQTFEGSVVRLSNLYLQQSLLDGRLDLKAGRFSTGADFLTSQFDTSFVNGALNPRILAIQKNVPGVTADPNTTWGGRVAARPVGGLSLAAGAFYSDPALNQLTANGTEFGIGGSAGYFVIGEAAYRLNVEKGDTGLPGRYRGGGYYDSNQYASITDPTRQQTGNYGFFLFGEQIVYREGAAGSAVGLSVFGTFIYAPQERINPLPYFASAGAGYGGSCQGGKGTRRASRSTTAASAATCRGRLTSWSSSGRTPSPSRGGSRSSPTSSTSSTPGAARASGTPS